jgi:excisionase family DNA binding protein
METPELLTVHETADRLRLSPLSTYRLIADGHLPAIRLGTKLLRVRADDLAKFLTPTAVPAPSTEFAAA